MIEELILAFVTAFIVSALVGKFLVPWLRHIKAGQAIKENGPTWHMSKAGTPTMDVRRYIYDMPLVMAAADLVICRSGASTLSELAALGKPAILVPSPNVTNNHQEKNARVLEKAGAAAVIPESEITDAKLLGSVSLLLSRPDTLEAMSEQMKEIGFGDATERITDIILDLARK